MLSIIVEKLALVDMEGRLSEGDLHALTLSGYTVYTKDEFVTEHSNTLRKEFGLHSNQLRADMEMLEAGDEKMNCVTFLDSFASVLQTEHSKLAAQMKKCSARLVELNDTTEMIKNTFASSDRIEDLVTQFVSSIGNIKLHTEQIADAGAKFDQTAKNISDGYLLMSQKLDVSKTSTCGTSCNP